MTLRQTFVATGMAVSALLAAPAIHAAPAYDELVVFGDSLSDNGNIFSYVFGYLPTAPYYQGRFTNGPVAVEVMAAELDIPLVNYAFGGASSGLDNEYLPGSNTGLRGQIDGYLGQLQANDQGADPADLFIVWGGGNDLLSAITGNQPYDLPSLIATTVENLADNVQTLHEAGARDVLVPLMPDMATSYHGTSGQYSASFLSGVTATFNTALRARMGLLDATTDDLTLRIFDTPDVLADLRQSMQDAGANVVDRCWTGEFRGAGTLCADPDKYYLFDRVHPTAVVHRHVGQAMAQAVPEASPLMLACFGLLPLLAVAARRRHK